MGERIIRPGIRSSSRTTSLVKSGGWMAQVFYDWLITVVDDYGRYDARPGMLRVVVFPLLLDLVREADVQRCLVECEKAGLIRLYTVGGKPYLELLNFNQRLRAKKSKWPAPAGQCHADAGHCHDNANGDGDGDGDGRETETECGAAKMDEGGQQLDSEVRQYITSHKRLPPWDPKTHGKCIQLVTVAGWARAKELVLEGISLGKQFPIGWALTKAASEDAQADIKADSQKLPPRRVLKNETFAS